MSSDRGPEEIRCQGVPASSGIARGSIHVFSIESDDVAKYQIDAAQIPDEIARFESALIRRAPRSSPILQPRGDWCERQYLRPHLLVVEDQTLIDEVLRSSRPTIAT
jgi:phosphoenolpyruvate-protein kinase (PTS system EI component)